MELEHSFIVPVPKSRAWDVLLDVEKVASCMPGATLDTVDGDEIRGRIKVKVGPISMMYAGTARFVERDEAAGVVVLEASGKETKGAGTASASVRSVLEDRGAQTHVSVHTTLNVTGKPAQFGRGVMSEVSGRLLNIFAENLAAMLAEGQPAGEPPAAAEAAGADAGGTAAGIVTETDAALSTAVEDLGLSARAVSTLHRDGISTVGALAAKSEDELLALDGIGPASVTEIREKLAVHGLSLGQPAAPAEATPAAAPAGPVASDSAAAAAAARANGHRQTDESLNLLRVAGLPVLKRALPVLAGLTAALLIGLRRRLRNRNRNR